MIWTIVAGDISKRTTRVLSPADGWPSGGAGTLAELV
jgi:hypothetical protein